MNVVALWALFAIGAIDLDIRGSIRCPTSAEVAARALPLFGHDLALPNGSWVHIEDVLRSADGTRPVPSPADTSLPLLDGELELRLENREGEPPLAVRRLKRSGSCGASAEAAAVIVASWAARYETPKLSALASLESPEDRGPAAVVRKGDASKNPSNQDDRRKVATADGRPPTRLSLGGGAWFGGQQTGGLAPMAGPELTVSRDGSASFLRLFVGAMGKRRVPLESGNAAWWRMIASIAVGHAWGRSVPLEAAAGAVFGPVMIRGEGFDLNQRTWAWDLGASAALRLVFRPAEKSGPLGWLGITTFAWGRPHRVSVDPSPSEVTLPHLDVLVGGGIAYVTAK